MKKLPPYEKPSADHIEEVANLFYLFVQGEINKYDLAGFILGIDPDELANNLALDARDEEE